MAKTTRTNSPAKAPALVARRRGRPPESKSAKPAAAPAARKTRQPAVAAKPVTTARKPPAAPSAPRPSKGELHDQVEKLERTVATLRSSLTRAGKGSLARIEELEERMAQLEEAASHKAGPYRGEI